MKKWSDQVTEGIQHYIEEKYNSLMGKDYKNFKWICNEVVSGLLYNYIYFKKNDEGTVVEVETSKLSFH